MAFRKKISILGFMAGSITDIVLTNIWGIIICIYIVVHYKLFRTPPAEISAQFTWLFKHDPFIFSANLIVGGCCSVLGGYVGALIAKHDELLNGALSSFFCVLGSIYSLGSGAYNDSLFLAIVSLVISPLLCMLGGYLRLLQRSRKKQTTPQADMPPQPASNQS
jgi:hypothetical protein